MSERQRRARTLVGGYLDAVWDQMDDEPVRRYAHVYSGALSWPVSTTDTPEPDPAYAEAGDWRHKLTVDLDTGLAVASEDGSSGWPVFAPSPALPAKSKEME